MLNDWTAHYCEPVCVQCSAATQVSYATELGFGIQARFACRDGRWFLEMLTMDGHIKVFGQLADIPQDESPPQRHHTSDHDRYSTNGVWPYHFIWATGTDQTTDVPVRVVAECFACGKQVDVLQTLEQFSSEAVCESCRVTQRVPSWWRGPCLEVWLERVNGRWFLMLREVHLGQDIIKGELAVPPKAELLEWQVRDPASVPKWDDLLNELSSWLPPTKRYSYVSRWRTNDHNTEDERASRRQRGIEGLLLIPEW